MRRELKPTFDTPSDTTCAIFNIQFVLVWVKCGLGSGGMAIDCIRVRTGVKGSKVESG